MFKKLLLTTVALLSCAQAEAATTPNSIITAQTPKAGLVQFLQGTDSAGTYKTLYTGSANGSKIVALWANTNDSTAHVVTCQLVRSAVLYGGVAISIPGNSGFTNGTPPVNIITSTAWPGLPLDNNGNPYIYLSNASDSLQCTFATALTASDLLNIGAVGSDF